MCVCMCMCTSACRNRKTASGVVPQEPSDLFFETVFSLGPMAHNSSRLAGERALRLVLSLSARVGITGVYHSGWHFKKCRF